MTARYYKSVLRLRLRSMRCRNGSKSLVSTTSCAIASALKDASLEPVPTLFVPVIASHRTGKYVAARGRVKPASYKDCSLMCWLEDVAAAL